MGKVQHTDSRVYVPHLTELGNGPKHESRRTIASSGLTRLTHNVGDDMRAEETRDGAFFGGDCARPIWEEKLCADIAALWSREYD